MGNRQNGFPLEFTPAEAGAGMTVRGRNDSTGQE